MPYTFLGSFFAFTFQPLYMHAALLVLLLYVSMERLGDGKDGKGGSYWVIVG